MEETALHDHKDWVGNLLDRVQQLVVLDEPAQKEPADPQQRGLPSHLALIETELCDVSNPIETIEQGPEVDHCLLEHHKEQVSGLKSELTDVLHNIVTLDDDKFGLAGRISTISKAIFNMHLQMS